MDVDPKKAMKWSRRGFIGALFSGAAVSVVAKSSSNPDYFHSFIDDLGDDVLFKPERADFSHFLTLLNDGKVQELVVTRDEILVTDNEGQQTLTGIADSRQIVDMIREGAINPRTVNVSFDSRLPYLKDHISPLSVGGTLVSYWDIPVAALTAQSAWQVAKDVKSDIDFYRQMAQRSPEEIEGVAYHEAGHALVRALKPGEYDLGDSTIEPEPGKLGLVHGVPFDPPRELTREAMYNEIMCDFAGRAAEEIFLGEGAYTTGYEQDFADAKKVAEDMIRWGMTEELGPIGYSFPEHAGKAQENRTLRERFGDFVGKFRSRDEVHSPTPEMLARMEEAREKILKDAMRDTKNFLLEHRQMLDAIAADLMVHQRLSPDHVRGIIDRAKRAQEAESRPAEPEA